MEEKMKLEK